MSNNRIKNQEKLFQLHGIETKVPITEMLKLNDYLQSISKEELEVLLFAIGMLDIEDGAYKDADDLINEFKIAIKANKAFKGQNTN